MFFKFFHNQTSTKDKLIHDQGINLLKDEGFNIHFSITPKPTSTFNYSAKLVTGSHQQKANAKMQLKMGDWLLRSIVNNQQNMNACLYYTINEDTQVYGGLYDALQTVSKSLFGFSYDKDRFYALIEAQVNPRQFKIIGGKDYDIGYWTIQSRFKMLLSQDQDHNSIKVQHLAILDNKQIILQYAQNEQSISVINNFDDRIIAFSAGRIKVDKLYTSILKMGIQLALNDTTTLFGKTDSTGKSLLGFKFNVQNNISLTIAHKLNLCQKGVDVFPIQFKVELQ